MSGNRISTKRLVLTACSAILCGWLAIAPAVAQGPPPGMGYWSPHQMPQAVHHPFPYSPQPGMPPGPGAVPSSTTCTGDVWEHGPLEKFLLAATQNAWIRLDYMLMEIERPGEVMLGAPLAGVNNPRLPFEITTSQGIDGMARVPHLGDITLRDKNGVRGTIGLPMSFATWETSFWSIDKAEDTTVPGELPTESPNPLDPNDPPPFFIGHSTLINGQLSDNVSLYDESFEASFSSKIWGAETKLVFNPISSAEWFTLQPMLGFNHLNIEEELRQVGVFTNFGTVPPLVSTIESESKNRIYGGMVGGRLEFHHHMLSVGFEPKVTLGLDNYRNQVRSDMFTGPADGLRITTDDDLIFSPIIELAIYLKLHVHRRMELHVGYNLLWAGRITRPYDNIVYDVNDLSGPLFPQSSIRVNTAKQSLTMEGLTVGGVIYLQ